MKPDDHPAVKDSRNTLPLQWQALTAGAALAAILLVAGVLFARQILSGGHVLATATTTVIPAPSIKPTTTPKIDWQAVSLPSDVSLGVRVMGRAQADFALAPAHGRRAWICVPTTSGQVTIWVTQDLGASWYVASTLTPITPEPMGNCQLVAAASDPDLIVLEVLWGGGEEGTLGALSYLSADGGAHWRSVPGKTNIQAVDQVGGATFALLEDTTRLTDPRQHADLVVSHDGLRTWRSITPPNVEAYGPVFRFWAQPTTGQLLAATLGYALWRSDDAGAHWVRLPTPRSQIDQALWLPQAQHWLVCAGAATCSEDLGATWIDLPRVQCENKGLTLDGTLILVCPNELREIFRVRVSTATATSLGSGPWPLTYLASTGELWSVAGERGAVTILPVQAP